MDPPGKDGTAESTPILFGTTQQKRLASPLQEQQRNVRHRPEDDPIPTNNEVNLPTTSDANNKPTNSAINNVFFPTFKLLRKINNKLITARHHKTFLTNLQENGQVPKGLQVKSAPTGAELDLTLYEEWETAHIELANRLRDILIKHWTETELNLQTQLTVINRNLASKAPEDHPSAQSRIKKNHN